MMMMMMMVMIDVVVVDSNFGATSVDERFKQAR